MGCSASSIVAPTNGIARHLGMKRKWKVHISKKEARKMYEEEGSLPKNCVDELLELRAYLDDPLCLSRLGSYAKSKKCLALLMFWTDVLEFKAIAEESHDYQLSKCLHIYHKYIKPDSLVALRLVYISSEFITQLQTAIDKAKDPLKSIPISAHIFDLLHRQCLLQIYANLYTEFRTTSLFRTTLLEFSQQYNQVSPADFDYFEELGVGNFGSVVRCRKKSTGIEYAMKVQSKNQLLNANGNAPQRVVSEVKVLSSCCHPFIVSMDYAFQTEALVMIVMALGTAGTLADWQKSGAGTGQKHLLSEEIVRFYAAEISLALFHIHRMGMIYRDLKPDNVVLNNDGHIQLVDMGGAIDVSTGWKISWNKDGVDDGGAGIFGADTARKQITESEFVGGGGASANHSIAGGSGSVLYAAESNAPAAPAAPIRNVQQGVAPDIPLPRAKSIMGTCGYMAPEMMAMASSKCSDKGYTAVVDYWSLGVTMFDLLTGELPFDNAYLVRYLERSRLSLGVSHREGTLSNKSSVRYDTRSQERSSMRDPDDVGGNSEMSRTAISTSPDFVYSGIEASSLLPTTKNVIMGFLDIEETKRLGAGVAGIRRVKAHPYFHGISWSKLAQKHVVPPFIPSQSARARRPEAQTHSCTFEEVLNNLNERGDLYLDNFPPDADQQYFGRWDFISPSILRKEMGIEEETEAVDDAFKQNWYSIDMTSLLNNVSVGIKRMASSNSQKILGVGTSPSRNGSAAAALPLMSAEDRSSPQ